MEEKERKKLKMQEAQVQAAILELEYKIEERLDDIERMKAHIVLQEARKAELHERQKGDK